MYLNKAIIIGNLTRDPEMKALPSGISVTSFSIATNRVWKDKTGTKQESADFHNIVAFGKTAESVNTYLKKGSQALVEGRIQTRSWEKDGQKRYTTEIIADTVQFGAHKESNTDKSENFDKQESQAYEQSKTQGRVPSNTVVENDINPEDIPF